MNMRPPRRERSARRCDVPGSDMVKVLVGKEQKEFELKRKPLAACSIFFRESLAKIQPTTGLPTPPSSAASSASGASMSSGTTYEGEDDTEQVLWLPTESPEVFELFVLWLYRRQKFYTFIDRAVQSVSPDAAYCRLPNLQTDSYRRALRWNLVRLHLFAELIDLPVLQDITMDALQDMYLRCDWAVSPGFMIFLYRDYDQQHAIRLRKWAIAMLAWTLHGADREKSNASHFERLFAIYPAMHKDYHTHLSKMAASNADVCIKNPQLRLPLNRLRNEERFFGFRQCSFHSHRAVVGEGICPHVFAHSAPLMTGGSRSRSPKTRTHQRKDSEPETLSDVERDQKKEQEQHEGIISPVGDLTETSFLDLS
ncbi:hypothetical protein V8F06_005469 [Rhypophila decipiens]